MKRKCGAKRIWTVAAALICFNLLSLCGVSRTFAKYTSQAAAGDTARVAAWEVEVTGTETVQDDIFAGISGYSSSEYESFGITGSTVDSHGYGTGGYRFTVVTGEATDAAGVLSVHVTVSKDGTEGWPEGITAALYSITGEEGSEVYTLLSENTDGIFTDVKTVEPGTAFTGKYLVGFKSTGACTAGGYDVTVAAAMEQID